jgi:uncharacterized protein YbjT (DUF2867 family)
MKYVITGGAGNISKPLAEKLLHEGHQVTVIGRNAANLKPLTDKGARAAIGSVEDETFITATFNGADAVYLMIPPNFGTTGWREYQNKVADIYVNALRMNKTKYAVVLSSVGAHMGNGSGPVDGLSDFEKKLTALTDTNVKNLRPSYFMSNLFGMIPLIKGMNIMGGNFGGDDRKLVLTHTDDIAEVAVEELLALNFTGQSVRYIAGDERTTADIAAVLSNAIGKPGIPWVAFSDEQAMGGMLQSGLPQTIAEGYTQLGTALREGTAEEDYWKNRPTLSKTKLEEFAKEFAIAFNA